MKYSIFLLISIFAVGCNQTASVNSKITFLDSLKYSNGNIYYRGEYILEVIDGDSAFIDINNRSYYFPDGKLWIQAKNDSNGGLLEKLWYNSNGMLATQLLRTNEADEMKYFDNNGRLNEIDITKLSDNSIDNDTSVNKEFYPNGMIFRETTVISGTTVSETIYDTLGIKQISRKTDNGRRIQIN